VCAINGISGGEVHFVSLFWKIQRGWGVRSEIPLAGGMDIFWKCTSSKLPIFQYKEPEKKFDSLNFQPAN